MHLSNASAARLSSCPCTGLEANPDRPNDKLPYRGAWLWIGPEMIHLMELPNPDPTERAKRPGVTCLHRVLCSPPPSHTHAPFSASTCWWLHAHAVDLQGR